MINNTDIKKEFKSIIKDTIIVGLCLFVMILLLLRSCGKKDVKQEPEVVTKVVYKNERLDTVYVPKSTIVYRPGQVPKTIEKWDTVIITELGDLQKDLIVDDYYSFYVYSDTAKNKYGQIIINDTISRNQILSRGFITQLSIPEVTRTITLVQPKRAAIFIGGGLFGNQKDIAAGYNVNLSLKTKKDRMIEVGYNQFFNGQGYYSVGYKHKISFRK